MKSTAEEFTVLAVACGQLIVLPADQLPDYYRGQRWIAMLCFTLLLLYSGLPLLC